MQTGSGPQDRNEGDEVAALLRGLRLGFIALMSAVVMAGLVIGIGDRRHDDGNPYYGELVPVVAD